MLTLEARCLAQNHNDKMQEAYQKLSAAGAILSGMRRSLASDALTGRRAKLDSQRIQREMGQPGLATFLDADIGGYVDEAIWLIECALLERSADPDSQWRNGVKRAAEFLELLSQRDLRPRGAPLDLLSAATYQVAGFPAMALAQLARMPNDGPFSNLLREVLRANFHEDDVDSRGTHRTTLTKRAGQGHGSTKETRSSFGQGCAGKLRSGLPGHGPALDKEGT